jgi:hypothetical protein
MNASWVALGNFEIRRLTGQPLGWAVLALAMLLLGWDFLARVDGWMILQESESLAGATVTDRIFMPMAAQSAQLLVVLCALLSVGSLGEDRSRGTDALLLSSPASSLGIAIGKWLGQLVIPLMIPVGILLMAASVEGGTEPDWGRMAAASLGLVLLACCCSAIALLISGLARQPVLGAVMSLGAIGLLWLADLGPRSRGIIDSPLEYLSLGAQMRPFLAGSIDTSAVVWLLSVTLGSLLLAAETLRPSRLALRLAKAVIVLGLIGAAITAGVNTAHRWDWTSSSRNSLSEPSVSLLRSIDGPVQVNVYASRDRRLRLAMHRFLKLWQDQKSDLTITFIDPAENPQLVRRQNLQVDGEVDLVHGGRSERLRQLSESEMANALQRLARREDHMVAYTWGSGERDLRGQTPFDMGRFGAAMESRGIDTQPLDLLVNPVIPDNLELLLITQPRQAMLPGVVDSLRRYVANGGNVLWLADPGSLAGLEPLAAELNLTPLPGIVVDARTAQYGLENPRLPVVVDYPDHPVTRDFRIPTVYPQALAWQFDASDGSWSGIPLIQTHASSWTETGAIEGQVGFDEGTEERAGPLILGLAMERPDRKQRAVVIGDADFLSNAYLGNAGNLDLGLRVVNWLLADDQLIQIPARFEADTRLELTPRTLGLIGLFWLLAVPGLMALSAGWIWWKRRRA